MKLACTAIYTASRKKDDLQKVEIAGMQLRGRCEECKQHTNRARNYRGMFPRWGVRSQIRELHANKECRAMTGLSSRYGLDGVG